MTRARTCLFLVACWAVTLTACADGGGRSIADTEQRDTSSADATPDTTPPSDADASDTRAEDVLQDTAHLDVPTNDTSNPPSDVSDVADVADLADSLADARDTTPVTDASDASDVQAPGEYTVDLIVTDATDVLSSYLMDPAAGAWNIFSGDTIYWGRRGTEPYVSYHTAMRFVDVGIPVGAEVLGATLSIMPHNTVDASHQLCLNVYAERDPSSAPFDPSNYSAGRPDQRLKTTAFIDRWVTRCVQSCNPNIEYDCAQREADCWDPALRYDVPKDLTALVQEVVDLPGWQSGNPLTLFVVNSASDSSYDLGKYNDSRIVLGFEAGASEAAPTLHVRYRIP